MFITLNVFIIGWISGGFLRGEFILRERFRFVSLSSDCCLIKSVVIILRG